jgi:hypothetical protein
MMRLPLRRSATTLSRFRLEMDGGIASQLLALAPVLYGVSRERVARIAGMDRQTFLDWVLRYSEAGVASLHDSTRPGRPCLLTRALLPELATLIADGPRIGTTVWSSAACGISASRPGDTSAPPLKAARHACRAAPDGSSWPKPLSIYPKDDLAAREAFKNLARTLACIHDPASSSRAGGSLVPGRTWAEGPHVGSVRKAR